MVVIVGGGITGLSAAWFLHQRGVPVRLLEAAPRLGGVIDSAEAEGFLVERGPNSTLQKPGTADDALGRLVAGAGLEARMVEAGAAGRKRYVLRGGRLQALPGGPPGFVTTGLFSWRAKARLLREPFIGCAAEEETIAQFVERRLGREFLDYAVEPFISGVYAGDPAALSVRAAVPRIYELERAHGSLIRGAIALGKAAKGAGTPAGRMVSFDRGMAVLPEGVGAALPEGACRTGCRAVGLRPDGEGWEVAWEGPGESAAESGVERAGTVILALPAGAAADLLAPHSEVAARVLRSIGYAPVASLALGYERDQVGHPLDGFGFLAPRREGLRVLGGLFSSTLFAGRAPDGRVLVTAFIGGTTDPAVAALGDDELAGRVSDDLARVLDISGAPGFLRITRYAAAIPQYTLGHLERLAELDRELAPLSGLHLQASWRGGVSVADCARNGEALAQQIADARAGAAPARD
jgi:oxygen-dependent protoporphyrinogen oxidase